MNQIKTNKKALIIGCIALVLLMAAFATIYVTVLDKPVEGSKTVTVDIVFADQSKKTVDIHTDAPYLRGALEEKKLITGTESEFGLFVETVDGIKADASKQEWWKFTKDGQDLNTGVDMTPIQEGDHFEITLTVGYGEF